MGFPEPLNMRPSMSWETGVFKTCKQIATEVFRRAEFSFRGDIRH